MPALYKGCDACNGILLESDEICLREVIRVFLFS